MAMFQPIGSGAKFVVQGYFPTTASSNLTRTNTAVGQFSTNANFPAPTIEITGGGFTVSANDFDTVKVQVDNAPAGIYKATFDVTVISTGGNGTAYLAVADGTGIPKGQVSLDITTASFSSTRVTGFFSYTTAANRAFEVYGAISANTLNLVNAGGLIKTGFTIEYFPNL